MRPGRLVLALLATTACSRATPAPSGSVVTIAAPAPSAAQPAASASSRRFHQLAGTWMASFRTSREHGCSQSFESSSAHGNLTIDLAESGDVRVHVTVDRSSTFGPSPGRYMAGERDFSHRRAAEERRWHGTAVREGEGFSVALQSSESSCQALPAYGKEGGVPTRCLQDGAVVLRCTPVVVEVLKGVAPEGGAIPEQGSTEPVEALRCTPWLGVYPSSSPELREGLPLGRAPGLEVREVDTIIHDGVRFWHAPLGPSERPH